jgi:hypothetical protein
VKLSITKDDLNKAVEYWLSQKHSTLVVNDSVLSVTVNYDSVDIVIGARPADVLEDGK